MSWLLFWTIFNLIAAALNAGAVVNNIGGRLTPFNATLGVLAFGAFIMLAGKL